jgi:hypothetical protein
MVRASQVPVAEGGELCFCTVNFPSRDTRNTRVIIDSDEPFISPSADNSLWEYRVYTTLNDGTTTESILYVQTPLRAGQLKVIKVHLSDDKGVIESDDATVGVSVTLDWGKIILPDIPL